MTETENQIRLRRAKDTCDSNRVFEADLRKALLQAEQSTKRAKERYEELFMAEEKAELARRKADYRHTTA